MIPVPVPVPAGVRVWLAVAELSVRVCRPASRRNFVGFDKGSGPGLRMFVDRAAGAWITRPDCPITHPDPRRPRAPRPRRAAKPLLAALHHLRKGDGGAARQRSNSCRRAGWRAVRDGAVDPKA